MRFPCEFVASSFLPNLRIRVAHELRNRGMSQNEIASVLGVKQPVVVSYLQKDLKDIGDKRVNPHLESLSSVVSDMLLSKESLEYVMRTICTKCKSLRVTGPICSVHKQMLPEISGIKDCNICSGFDTIPSIKTRTEILQNLDDTLEKMKLIEDLYLWIPEIGSQLAHCGSDAKDLDDVASFPGRIIKVKEQITNVSSPEFGCSKTSSLLLLWMKRNHPDIQWILSLKTKDELKDILREAKIKYIETEHLDLEKNQILSEIEKENRMVEVRVIIDKASPGFESISYVFAKEKKELFDIIGSLV
jgi:predicted fused transcriptional regulator/phosphomethylpyrimidine kinase/predicted transcriptional regulator